MGCVDIWTIFLALIFYKTDRKKETFWTQHNIIIMKTLAAKPAIFYNIKIILILSLYKC